MASRAPLDACFDEAWQTQGGKGADLVLGPQNESSGVRIMR
ncbi:hypothetical protein [Bacillus sp. ISL-34]|nr:hypothetical protein [Bacillus sp. ISL-34]